MLAEPFALHLPAGTAAVYQQRIEGIPQNKRTQWRYHRVVADDTLASVARSFHVSVDQLATANQLHEEDTLASVEALVIPVAQFAAPARHTEVYRARKGETLISVADRFGVSLDDLHRWNQLSGSTLTAGQRIRVTEPAHVASHGRSHAASAKSKSNKSDEKSTESAAHKDAGSGGAAGGIKRASGKHRAPSGKSAATTKKSTSSEKSAADKKSSSDKKSTAATHKSGGSKASGVDQKSTSKKNVKK
jgi:membrane-bound lytic murein transglycosylase D